MPAYMMPPWQGPPAPLATIVVHGHRLGAPASQSVRALLDTGADYTEIPNALARQMELRQRGEKRDVRGVENISRPLPKYLARIELDGRLFEAVVLGSDGLEVNGERWAIVGRDILNEAVTLNWPRLTYDVAPATSASSAP